MKIKIKLDPYISPRFMLYNNEWYKIKEYHEKCKIKEYYLYLSDNNSIEKLELLCYNLHPNCDKNTFLFCLPDIIKNCEYNKNIEKYIQNILSVYNLDNCYYRPWNYFKWDKI